MAKARKKGPGLRGLLLVLLFFTGFWVLATEIRPGDESWARVERRDLVIGVEVEGELEAIDSVGVGPPQIPRMWNFKISMMAPEGSETKAGQPILGFDVTEVRRRLQQQVAERDSAEKQLEKLRTDLDVERRGHELQLAESRGRLRKAELKLQAPEAVLSRFEVEKAKVDRRLAELEIRSMESSLRYLEKRSVADIAALREKRDRAAARVEELQSHMAQMTVRAPREGTLIYLSDWRGNKKKVGDTVWRAEKVLEIPDMTRMQAKGTVSEADAGRLAEGQPVSLRLDAYPDRRYRGQVRSIRGAVQRKSPTQPQKVVKLEIQLDATDVDRMRPGMRFRGEVEVERVASTLVVPEEAVIPRPGGAVVVVRSLWGGRREVAPTFGPRNADEFGVVEGLDEGDRVLVGDGEEGES